jgi:hypothetical protein
MYEKGCCIEECRLVTIYDYGSFRKLYSVLAGSKCE